jgi:Na+/phosphate symporter
MSVRRELFRLWCVLTVLVWFTAILGGDRALIVMKFQRGDWQAAFVHLTFVVIIAVVIPLVVLLVGRVVFWIIDRISQKQTRPLPNSN